MNAANPSRWEHKLDNGGDTEISYGAALLSLQRQEAVVCVQFIS